MKRLTLAALGLAALMGSTALGTGLGFAGSPPDGARKPRAEHVMSPERMADRCKRQFAGAAAKLTYLETRLAPTEAQKPAWQAYKDAVEAAEATNRDACVAAVPVKAEEPVGPPDIVTRETMKVKRLEAELSRSKATLPALQKLYSVLTPEQRAMLDEPAPRRHHDRPKPASLDRPAPGAMDDT
ncbi:Spy/CpxP family protein refolding chaperone, partial [Zavarzinia sp.]|uniref:Spy/CpxP family protein refolding chaperone n=1 Tax=Zavarzinia sp. TaxID=2027920 RepID=UPI003BB7D919